MEQRSVGKFIAFSLLTLGIYTIVWFFWTSRELREKGQEIPTAWLQLIPLANLYFYYKHFAAAEVVTNGKINTVLYFVLALFVSPLIPAWLEQNEFNNLATAPAGGVPPQQPQADPNAAPTQSEAAPAAPEAPASPSDDTPPVSQPVQDVAPAPTPEPAAPETPPSDVATSAEPSPEAQPPAPEAQSPEAPAENAGDDQQQPPATPPSA